MATVNGSGVRTMRERKDLSQRALARRVAGRLGDPERAATLGVAFSRIERRQHSDLDDEIARALAEELAVGVPDLGERVLFTWAHRVEGDRYSFLALGLRQPLWSSQEAALNGRDVIAAELEPLGLNIARGATNVPIFRQAVRRTMEDHFGDLAEHELESLLVVDPSAKAVRELATAQVALSAENAEDRRAAGQAWARAAAEGILETAGPDEFFNLTERRAARGDDPDAQWRGEHKHLTDAALEYLRRRCEHLRERREPVGAED